MSALHPWERAVVHVAERMALTGRGHAARSLLGLVALGIPEDDAFLDSAFELLGAGTTVAEVWREMDALLYRDGERVTLPTYPCPHSLRKWDNSEDPARERPCLLAAGHPDGCRFADAPLHYQRTAALELFAEMVAVAKAMDADFRASS